MDASLPALFCIFCFSNLIEKWIDLVVLVAIKLQIYF